MMRRDRRASLGEEWKRVPVLLSRLIIGPVLGSGIILLPPHVYEAVRRAGCRRSGWSLDNVRFDEKLGFTSVGTPPERDRAIGEYQCNQKMIHMVWEGSVEKKESVEADANDRRSKSVAVFYRRPGPPLPDGGICSREWNVHPSTGEPQKGTTGMLNPVNEPEARIWVMRTSRFHVKAHVNKTGEIGVIML